ncbi:lipid A biosynthesis lauroyl acyltransferase [Dissulfuribacter thermophilus]|uniref:Lipid A biosynthesis lauroyl acyltransferase n=1 Tax=Dissulfuribacter thermophilus TaxID=1156395 RepID=A0A1B9F328_9BACT|nr:lysophospholipid acyltransferase family protein [Dissulfuribacter thermophilus]OCC14273.1 lipid A biosynthesis lauroyl acyltransferase [Dissulfuribacter thermophilus]
MAILNFRYPYISVDLEKPTTKKFFDYTLFLNAIAKLPYNKMIRLAFWRGRGFAETYKSSLELIKENLSTYYGRKKTSSFLDKVANDIFLYSSLEEAEGARIAQRRDDYFEKWIDINGISNLEGAVSRGKGVILAFTHYGSYASVICKLGQMFSQPIHGVAWPYETHPCPIFRNFIHRKVEGMRHFMKGDFFFVGKINPRRLYSALNRNEMIVILIDAPLGSSYKIPINFLARKINLPISAFKIALRTGAAIVPIAVYRADEGKKIVADILPYNEIHEQQQIQPLFQSIMMEFEKYIEKNPSQFFYWTSPMSWKTINTF